MGREKFINSKYEARNPKQIQMTKNPKQYDLEDRTLAFAKNVRTFVKKLRKTIATIEDGKQLVKSSVQQAQTTLRLMKR